MKVSPRMEPEQSSLRDRGQKLEKKTENKDGGMSQEWEFKATSGELSGERGYQC